ncbi:MAG: hypothetical protein L3K06_07910, partial [Thermoplasmata archaeon]|nr:hypothetical protein [Thermoplasmata archaeon]
MPIAALVAVFGFAGFVFAGSGTTVKHVGPGAKIAKPVAVSDEYAPAPAGGRPSSASRGSAALTLPLP